MLLQFTRLDDLVVFVNPQRVTRLVPHAQQPDEATLIYFGKEDWVAVATPIDAVAERLNRGL